MTDHPRLRKIRRAMACIKRFAYRGPFELWMSAALILFGTRALLDVGAAPGSIADLPDWLTYTYCGLSIVAGVLTIGGMIASRWLLWAPGIVRAGLYLSTAAWLSYVIGLWSSFDSPRSTLLILALACVAAGSFTRARAIAQQDHDTIQALRRDRS